MKEQIEEMAIEEMSRFITCVDIETEPEGTCCRMNFEQADTMACSLYNAGYRKQKEVIDEFVKRLLDAFPEPHRGGNLCPAIYYDDYRYIIEELAEEMKGGDGK